MDEHDKRAREWYAAEVTPETDCPCYEQHVGTLADLFRSTAAAAERRIAARLRARADEEVGKVAEMRARWFAHEDCVGDAARIHLADHAADLLRAEADALEVGT